MRVVDTSLFENALVIHFEVKGQRINAYTLASTLVALADAAKAANATINFGYDVEVVVEAIGPGSFRAKIRTIYATARNLFSDQRLQAVVLSIIASFIYERTFSVDHSVRVDVQTDEVIIERGGERVIIPRNVYDATRNAERNPEFSKSIARTMDAIAADDDVGGIGFVPEMTSARPEILIPKEVLRQASAEVPDQPPARTIDEQCDLQIVKAILERSRRKWEFMWRGVKISAPVLDDRFYQRFFAHEIMIAPGDVLEVRLAIRQSRDSDTEIYSNVGYEVVEVFRHVPRLRQMPLSPRSSEG